MLNSVTALFGGFVFVSGGGELSVTNSSLEGGHAGAGGGCISIDSVRWLLQ